MNVGTPRSVLENEGFLGLVFRLLSRTDNVRNARVLKAWSRPGSAAVWREAHLGVLYELTVGLCISVVFVYLTSNGCHSRRLDCPLPLRSGRIFVRRPTGCTYSTSFAVDGTRSRPHLPYHVCGVVQLRICSLIWLRSG